VLLGALGVSGDTSCADHNIAWKLRDRLGLDFVPKGVSPTGDDNIIYDFDPATGTIPVLVQGTLSGVKDGEPLAVAESPFFRARGNGIPDETDEAVAAHRSLCERLESAGWQHVASGKSWFANTYARSL
jgi:hypothetical protein